MISLSEAAGRTGMPVGAGTFSGLKLAQQILPGCVIRRKVGAFLDRASHYDLQKIFIDTDLGEMRFKAIPRRWIET